ncbi:MAG: iron-containing alcohol dehydrogenase [Acidobacteriota bacterium]
MINFYMPTRIIFGQASISRLKQMVEADLEAKKLFLVTDKGIVNAGIAEKVASQFPDIAVYDEIEANPRHHTVNRGGELAQEFKPDLVIGLGGGSALDSAKAISLLATNGGGIEDYEGKEKYRLPPLPVVAVPTTCGTGSEVTWVSVVTHVERKFKMSIKGPHMFPVLALVDPDLLISLPAHLVASTGLDALTHAVEAFISKAATPFTDVFALRSFQLIIDNLERAYRDIKNDKEAREKIMLGSTLAGIAFGNSDVGAVHCLSEAVGSLYDTPHGIANSVFLPYVLEFNLPESVKKYAVLAQKAGIKEKEERKAAQMLIQKIRDLSHLLGIPSLRELGIEENKFKEIALKSFQNNSNPSNPRQAGVDDYLGILHRTYQGK